MSVLDWPESLVTAVADELDQSGRISDDHGDALAGFLDSIDEYSSDGDRS